MYMKCQGGMRENKGLGLMGNRSLRCSRAARVPLPGDLRYAPAEIRISNFREPQNPARLQYKI
jgi:hypothetical protein